MGAVPDRNPDAINVATLSFPFLSLWAPWARE